MPKRLLGMMRWIFGLLMGMVAMAWGQDYGPSREKVPLVPREFRGTWVACVYNIDWPSRKGLSAGSQQAELRRILDRMAGLNMNAIIFQVRPQADAVYKSRIELPNFLGFRGVNGFSGHPDTGIHEHTRAVGEPLASLLGTPVSLGCLRVSDFAAKFLRWYLPRGARLFVRADEDLYRTFPPSPVPGPVARSSTSRKPTR